jgi:hypothetical protein
MPRLIDADALLEDARCDNALVAYLGGIETIQNIINDQPTIEVGSVPQWIPVTERLPEEDGDLYIVTAYNEEIWWNRVVVLCAEYYRGSWTWNENGREWDLTDSVTHWMPMPKPPEDGGTE